MQFSFEVSYPLCFCFVVNLFLLPLVVLIVWIAGTIGLCRDDDFAHERLKQLSEQRVQVIVHVFSPFESIGRRSEGSVG